MLGLIILSQVTKLIHFQYNSQGCLTCHTTPILEINDSTYILGSLHYDGNYLRPMLIGLKVKDGIEVQWYKAFTSNPDLHLDISVLAKVNDSLIAVGGGHGDYNVCTSCSFVGLFNIKTQNFIWAKYFQNKGIVKDVAFDGKDLILAIHGYGSNANTGCGVIAKIDTNNGNIIWAKEISFFPFLSCGWFDSDIYSVIPENNGYIILGVMWANFWIPQIYRIDSDGNSLTEVQTLDPYNSSDGDDVYRAYKMIRDIEGNYVIIGFDELLGEAYLTKINSNGNILLSKKYTSNDDLRFYDIALDPDNNYVVSGSLMINNTSYPMVLKINKDDGNVIWAGYWDGAPPGQSYNQARGIIPIKTNKVLITGYLGSAVDSHNGFFAILDSVGSDQSCLKDFSVSVSDIQMSYTGFNSPYVQDYNLIGDLTLTTYDFLLQSTPRCQITPLNDNEYKDCNFRIYAGRGFIGIKSNKEIKIEIYDISGKKVKEVIIKEGNIRLKSGIYIVRVGNESVKLVVR